MRILVISDYRAPVNVVRSEGAIFIGLQSRGHAVTVMTRADAPYTDQLREAGITVIDFLPAGKMSRQSVATIRQVLVEGAYDIMHLFNKKAAINGIRAARGLPVKILLYRGYAGNVHWWDPTAYFSWLHPRVDAITCVSPAVKEEFDRLPTFPSSKAVVVSKGHDAQWYEGIPAADLSAFQLPPDRVLFTMVANARRMKGLKYLVAAIEQLPADLPAAFLLVGRGLDADWVRSRIRDTPYASRTAYAGFRTDVLSLVQASDIGVLPSIKGEGLSKTALEFMFLGKAMILTSIGGNRELGIDGQTAKVVPPKDATALARAIEALSRDANLRQHLAEGGKRHVRTQFTTKRSVREMEELYQRLVG